MIIHIAALFQNDLDIFWYQLKSWGSSKNIYRNIIKKNFLERYLYEQAEVFKKLVTFNSTRLYLKKCEESKNCSSRSRSIINTLCQLFLLPIKNINYPIMYKALVPPFFPTPNMEKLAPTFCTQNSCVPNFKNVVPHIWNTLNHFLLLFKNSMYNKMSLDIGYTFCCSRQIFEEIYTTLS